MTSEALTAALEAIPLDKVPAAIAHLAARLLSEPHAAPAPSDDLLTPDEVADRLGTHKKWVYRHADQLGAVRLSGRALRFTEAGVAAYVRRRTGR